MKKQNVLYSYSDATVYAIQHDDIYAWLKQSNTHFDMSKPIRPKLKEPAHKQVLGKFKEAMHTPDHDRFYINDPDGIFNKMPMLNEFNEVKSRARRCK